jgi:hypothetical protein
MDNKMENCPFCGSSPEIEPDEDRPLVKCGSASCTASELWFTPEDWNNRPTRAKLAALETSLKKDARICALITKEIYGHKPAKYPAITWAQEAADRILAATEVE